jgi:glycosyltransferase involved in cell wall biosynthesis
MKILMVSNYFPSHTGGIEIVAEQLYRAFAARGQKVRWLAADSTPPPPAVGESSATPLRVWNFVEDRTGLPFPIPTPASVRTIFGEVGAADVVLMHDCLYLQNLLAFVAARVRHKPIVVVQHIGFLPYRNRMLNAAMRLATALMARPMLSSADQAVFISEATKDHFGDLRFRIPPETIFNGVDTEIYHPAAEDECRSLTRRAFDLPADRNRILFVGRFVEKKGMSALRRMVALRPEWIWIFAGHGPLNPSDWMASNVRVFSGLHDASMAALYRACDVLVLPSYGEGFPLVIQEAFACGLPVVCGGDTLRADPAMAAFVKTSPVYPEDPSRTANSFIDVLDAALTPGEWRISASRDRQAFVKSRYSWVETAERYLEIIRRLHLRLSPHSGTPISGTTGNCP